MARRQLKTAAMLTVVCALLGFGAVACTDNGEDGAKSDDPAATTSDDTGADEDSTDEAEDAAEEPAEDEATDAEEDESGE